MSERECRTARFPVSVVQTLPRVQLGGLADFPLTRKFETRQHRKWLLHHCDHLLQFIARCIEPDVTYTIGVFKCGNDVVFTFCPKAADDMFVINSDGKCWPDMETLPNGSFVCAEDLDIETVWGFKYDLSPSSTDLYE